MENVKAILLERAEEAEDRAKSSSNNAKFHRSQVEMLEASVKDQEQIAAECRAAIEKLS